MYTLSSFRTENHLHNTDVSSWLMQHDVTMKGNWDSCHGNLQHLGNITEDLEVTLRDNEEQSDSVQTACVSHGNVADIDNNSAACAISEYSSVEQVTHCTMDSVIVGTKSGDISHPSHTVHGECHINIPTHRNISKNMECEGKSNLSPKCYPQLVDSATQTEAAASADRKWTGLANVSRYLRLMLAQIIKIRQHIHGLMQWLLSSRART